jgi:hypothetical protein
LSTKKNRAGESGDAAAGGRKEYVAATLRSAIVMPHRCSGNHLAMVEDHGGHDFRPNSR